MENYMKTEIITSDVLIIGGGTSGCYAALTIAEQNPELKVVIAEKANIIRSGCLAAGVNALNAYITEGRKPEDLSGSRESTEKRESHQSCEHHGLHYRAG